MRVVAFRHSFIFEDNRIRIHNDLIVLLVDLRAEDHYTIAIIPDAMMSDGGQTTALKAFPPMSIRSQVSGSDEFG